MKLYLLGQLLWYLAVEFGPLESYPTIPDLPPPNYLRYPAQYYPPTPVAQPAPPQADKGRIGIDFNATGIIQQFRPMANPAPRPFTPDLNIPIRSITFDFSVPPFGGNPGKMASVSYPVAEFVVPIDDHVLNPRVILSPCGNACSIEPERKPLSIENQLITGQHQLPSEATLEGQLITLITTKIAPHTWASKGGQGTIQYQPKDMTLIVNQSSAVHKQIIHLLAKLHSKQEEHFRTYTLEVKYFANEQRGEPQCQTWPRVSVIKDQWCTMEMTTPVAGNNLRELLAQTARPPVQQASFQKLIDAAQDSLKTGLTVRARWTPAEAGQVKLDLDVHKSDLDQVGRDGLTVAGQTFRIVRYVNLGQRTRVVIQRDRQDNAQAWLEVTVTEPREQPASELVPVPKPMPRQ